MPVPRTTVSLRKASKWPDKRGRTRHNRVAYKIFLRAHGKEAAFAYPNAKAFLRETTVPDRPHLVHNSWYGRLLGDNRYWIQTGKGKIVGVVGYSSQWVDKSHASFVFTKFRYKVRHAVNPILPRKHGAHIRHRVRETFHKAFPKRIVFTPPDERTVNEPPSPDKRIQNAIWRLLRRRADEGSDKIAESKTLPDEEGLIRIAEIGIAVDPKNQRGGIGSQAIEQVCEILKKKGFEFVYFDTENPQLISFARNRGWEEIPFTITGISLKGRPGDFRYFIKKL